MKLMGLPAISHRPLTLVSNTPWLAHRPCPLCGCDGKPFAQRLPCPSPAENLGYEEVKQAWRGFFKEPAFFTYCRCPDCDLLYCPEYFTQPALNQLYSAMEDNTASVPLHALERTQSGYFKLLAPYSAFQ